MDDQQIRAVVASFEALEGRYDEFAVTFYEHLFAAAPETRPMFKHDMTLQREKLVNQLQLLVHALEHIHEEVALATELGHRHVSYGVTPAHYDIMLGVMIDTLRDTLGDSFDDETEVAWRRAYHLIAELMMHGAAYGAVQPESS
jgi:hemoglobin-like flavoprotein